MHWNVGASGRAGRATESGWAPIGLHVGDALGGSGLLVLLGLAGASLAPEQSVAAMGAGGAAFFLWVGLGRPRRAPVWLCLGTSTLNLVVGLSDY
jgi:hypothetical protein